MTDQKNRIVRIMPGTTAPRNGFPAGGGYVYRGAGHDLGYKNAADYLARLREQIRADQAAGRPERHQS